MAQAPSGKRKMGTYGKGLLPAASRRPVTENERLAVNVSLAPVCLPEEARLASMLSNPPGVELERPQLNLFPADDDRRTLHVVTQGARVGRRGDRLEISAKDEPSQL